MKYHVMEQLEATTYRDITKRQSKKPQHIQTSVQRGVATTVDC